MVTQQNQKNGKPSIKARKWFHSSLENKQEFKKLAHIPRASKKIAKCNTVDGSIVAGGKLNKIKLERKDILDGLRIYYLDGVDVASMFKFAIPINFQAIDEK